MEIMNYFPIPIGGLVTGNDIENSKRNGVTPGNIGAYATTAEFNAVSQMSVVEGNLKLWRDNGFIWDPNRQSTRYAMLKREKDGSVTKRSVIAAQAAKLAAGANPLEVAGSGEPDEIMWILSSACWNFLASYTGDFDAIPDMQYVTFERAEAMRFSPDGRGTISDIPISEIFPSDSCPVFHPVTGIPCFMKFADYIRENPKPKSAAKPSGMQFPDAELADVAKGILASSMTQAAKGAAIRKAAQ